MNKKQGFQTKNKIHNNWQVVHQQLLPEEKEKSFWCNATFNKLRESIFNRFKDYDDGISDDYIKKWEDYKVLNNIKKAKPKKLNFCWETTFYKEGTNGEKGLTGCSELEFEHYDKTNGLVIIKDPINGIGWEYDEPREGEWIGIPEKLAEKFVSMESFKN